MDNVQRHPLDNIEDVEEFYEAIKRSNLTKSLSEERPYTYWTIELYDQANGIRGGGGLGILAADTRRVAEQMNVPFCLITPFYPKELHQVVRDGVSYDEFKDVKYEDFGFEKIDTVNFRANGGLCRLEVVEKRFKASRILAITEPGFRELYHGDSCGDHRLYQEVALGFGGYQALKVVGLKPAIMQLNEVATFFAALARLDELASNGMDFYEAVVYTRKHTLYTNHTLVQAAEASYSYSQFEKYVFPNLRSRAVKKWLKDKFENGMIRLSSVTIEIAELKSGVSKLHARVANYHDLSGEKVKFKPITNGIDIPYWILPDTVQFYKDSEILDKFCMPTLQFEGQVEKIDSAQIREVKKRGREFMNAVLEKRTDQNGKSLHFNDNKILFDFKRRFVDYKRPWLPFTRAKELSKILEEHNAVYVLSGRVHAGDARMMEKLNFVFDQVRNDLYLSENVFYIPDYDEEVARALSVGSNVTINIPIVGLEACGTSWEKDVGNMCLLVSTHDGGVADASSDAYLSVSGKNENEELDSLFLRMKEAAEAWENDFELEFLMRKQLKAYLSIISGTRMLRDYLNYLF